MTDFKDRIVELRRIPSSELIPNPKNWREHPPEQAAALEAVLDDIGIADVSLGVDTADGVMLIDGHLRKELIDQDVPVLILDLDPDEMDVMLATLDPLAAMAKRDPAALLTLIAESPGRSKGVNDLLQAMAKETQIEVRASGAGDFLDDFLAGHATDDDDLQTEEAGKHGGTQYFRVSFTVDAYQRDTIMNSLKAVRDSNDLGTTVDALMLLCDGAT